MGLGAQMIGWSRRLLRGARDRPLRRSLRQPRRRRVAVARGPAGPRRVRRGRHIVGGLHARGHGRRRGRPARRARPRLGARGRRVDGRDDRPDARDPSSRSRSQPHVDHVDDRRAGHRQPDRGGHRGAAVAPGHEPRGGYRACARGQPRDRVAGHPPQRGRHPRPGRRAPGTAASTRPGSRGSSPPSTRRATARRRCTRSTCRRSSCTERTTRWCRPRAAAPPQRRSPAPTSGSSRAWATTCRAPLWPELIARLGALADATDLDRAA